ncbi:MAG: cyclic nucleotide-binding domain-containing protein [Gammaproteobacteria bacterium]|nr:cyclic nucleotide-binding domain-containing protein [Gammaproteobacteria bacterium]MDH5728592.1 cyclic nucleotide-binding domain-containing protein [Gammaproteobacteria bacterium]
MTSEKLNLVEFLNQQYLCESLTVKEVQTLLDYTDVVEFKKGDVIADIGDVGEALFFVLEGEAVLMHEDNGDETEVGQVHKGELVGEMSFFDRQPRSVRLRAGNGKAKLLKLTRTMYSRLRVEHPYIAVNLLEHAIVSLDHLFRRVSSDVATFSHYLYGKGKH